MDSLHLDPLWLIGSVHLAEKWLLLVLFIVCVFQPFLSFSVTFTSINQLTRTQTGQSEFYSLCVNFWEEEEEEEAFLQPSLMMWAITTHVYQIITNNHFFLSEFHPKTQIGSIWCGTYLRWQTWQTSSINGAKSNHTFLKPAKAH